VRYAVLLLLLGNLLVFAWQQWVVRPPVADPAALPGPSGPGLRLLRTGSAPVPGSGRTASAPAWRCERFGPFADREVAGAVAGALRSRRIDVELTSQSGEIFMGHWVQVPALENRERADAALERITAAGLADAYVVSGDAGYRISLGVFRDGERAERVARIARGAGFDPVTTDRYRPGTEIWLALRYPADRSPDFGELGGESTQILRHEPMECPSGPRDGRAAD